MESEVTTANNDGVYFSPSVLAFYPEAWKNDGTYTDETWPSDAIKLNEDEVALFWKQSAPEGKVLAAEKGRPVWVDAPPPTKEEQIGYANSEKNELMALATAAIAPLQDAVDLDMATDEEAAALTAWKKYRVLLNRVDTSTAPNITWPTKPE